MVNFTKPLGIIKPSPTNWPTIFDYLFITQQYQILCDPIRRQEYKILQTSIQSFQTQDERYYRHQFKHKISSHLLGIVQQKGLGYMKETELRIESLTKGKSIFMEASYKTHYLKSWADTLKRWKHSISCIIWCGHCRCRTM